MADIRHRVGPQEWVCTELTFDLSASGSETVVLFTQAGWREPVPFMHHCSTKWAVFLLGLKAGLEGGKATPFPDDLAISSWGLLSSLKTVLETGDVLPAGS